MSKTICIYHSRDLDGWMSAAIVKKWFKDQNINKIDNFRVFNYGDNPFGDYNPNHQVLEMLGWDYGDKIPDLSEYNSVIMCDMSFSKETMKSIEFSLEYGNPEGEHFIWIDHHKSAILDNDERNYYGLRDTKFAACELTWMYFFDKPMPEIVRLLGRYDCFGHKGTDEELKVLNFQYGARAFISNYNDAYSWLNDELENIYDVVDRLHSYGLTIYNYLCTEAKQTYNKAFKITLNERMSLQDDRNYYDFLCVNQERFNPINFGIDYHKDGYDGFACFWYKDGKWTFSLYNDNGEVDCSIIAKSFGGGGHKGASGFVINDINDFLNTHKV